jgi:phosphoenolpyruvate synthase/pyruvate phosphate dikinase
MERLDELWHEKNRELDMHQLELAKMHLMIELHYARQDGDLYRAWIVKEAIDKLEERLRTLRRNNPS